MARTWEEAGNGKLLIHRHEVSVKEDEQAIQSTVHMDNFSHNEQQSDCIVKNLLRGTSQVKC